MFSRPTEGDTTRPWYVGLPPGLEAEEMVRLIRRDGPPAVAEQLRGGFVKLAFEGDDAVLASGLLRWTVSPTKGAAVFWRVGDDGKPDTYKILCVNAPESDRAHWEQQIDGQHDVILVLYQAPGGRKSKVADGPF